MLQLWSSVYSDTCSWFSRALYIFHEFALISNVKEVIFMNFFAMYSVCVILLKYFKVLYFTNLICTTKFLKYKSLEGTMV